jgi:hypothetical protein
MGEAFGMRALTCERRCGDSRFLLEALREAYMAAGKQHEAGQAGQRRQTLLARRLY